jgi:hypothetical protein
MKRASAANKARNRSRKSGIIGLVGMRECMHFQAQFPNELSTLIDRDTIPIQSVGVCFRFLLAGAE